ncbi:putative twin-arginine translocation pathway signal protein [Phaeoacremonium minimum UCRPA7]|uniref:Putative twin-arginine translocation pathway signal protein n=1 Tax=Phaeoacremonium minimum (strain UCR-PA7) TaxID=1286976 RepID=R8BJL7_PHAM7|nr:putative twin-arginine translocation pathway signal protein [Phaeoacremonium minimum UCRPA7]EON99520.1 putative twin-arginine translocation pathway signal protein [Phaeoacremonium minimum UCRPA7]
MPSIMKTAIVAGLAAVATALPSHPRFTSNQMKIHEVMKRQSAAEQALGITDLDVLQFALTLEWLETSFYQQGFAKFPASDFTALGLSELQVNDLLNIGASEAAHVELLQGALAQAGIQPVQPCTYNFDAAFADAKAMVTTAAVLEQVGVSAYLGAAPILSDSSILATAGSIFSIEARHQTFIRAAAGLAAAPSPFDTPLSPQQVFSLAAPFISSCPDGSNLILTAFPTLTQTSPAADAAVKIGDTLVLSSTAAAGATFCAFTAGGIPGGTAFTPFTEAAGCQIPQNLAGTVYVNLASAGPLDGKLTDSIIMAGPLVLAIS